MTSNIGSEHIDKMSGLGFGSGLTNTEGERYEQVKEKVMSSLKEFFRPEFLNRLDEVIVFTSLSDSDLMQILELLVQGLNVNLVHKAITISVTDEAKRWILAKTAADRSYGARPLQIGRAHV